MFHFLHNIFTLEDKQASHYPDALVQLAIERAVDGTDPRLRILGGYARQLRPAVLRSVDHVVTLVEALPDPATTNNDGRKQNPALAALFSSTARMGEILASDPALRAFREANPHHRGAATALLLVECNTRRGFGYGLVQDQLVADVPQTVVSFDAHRLIDVASDAAETRRLLRHRAFDYLLSRALAAVSLRRDERDDLSQRRALLRSKLQILERGGGFHTPTAGQTPSDLQTMLADIETKLAALGGDDQVLPKNLAQVCDVLGAPDKYLWLSENTLRLDAHYLLHDVTDKDVPETTFHQFNDNAGREQTVLLISIPSES